MKRAWWSLGSLCLALFAILSSSTALNTMLNAMANDLNLSTRGVGWLVNSYWLVTCVFVVLGGQLGDRFGRRKLYWVGLAIFFLGLVVCAISIAGWMAILARSLQGLGAALVIPATISILNVTFPPEKKATAFAVWGTTIALATAVGPLLGGFITDAANWRAVFYLLMPLPILAFLLAMLAMPETQGEKNRPFDWWGVITLGIGVFMLVFALEEGPNMGWTNGYVLGAIILSTVNLIMFFGLELKLESPLVHLKHLKRPEVLVGNFATLAFLMSFISVQYLLNLYWQNQFTQEYTAFHVGLMLMALGTPYVIFSLSAGKFMNIWTPKWTVFWGMLAIGIGTMLFGLLQEQSPLWQPLCFLALMGMGQGWATASSTEIATSSLPKEEAGEASGINSLFRYFGGVLGVVLGGLLYQNFSKSRVNDLLSTSSLSVDRNMIDAILVGSEKALVKAQELNLMPQIKPLIDDGLTRGLNMTLMVVGAINMLAAILVPIFIRKSKIG